MNTPTFFASDAARTTLSALTPLADWDTGMNFGGSCAQGIGINVGAGAVVGSPEQFTLLDQREDARDPQSSQHIGGSGLGSGVEGILPQDSVRTAINDDSGSGDIGVTRENVGLVDLATGWEAPVVP